MGTYAEALVRPAEDASTLRVAVDAITALAIRPAAPTAAIARDAARFRGPTPWHACRGGSRDRPDYFFFFFFLTFFCSFTGTVWFAAAPFSGV